ncbi:hypothetical protein PHAVU_004G150700 [Phaseolus vulgaris]
MRTRNDHKFIVKCIIGCKRKMLPKNQISDNENFIDKTFSIVANILLRIIPTTSGEKRAFTYYRDGVI